MLTAFVFLRWAEQLCSLGLKLPFCLLKFCTGAKSENWSADYEPIMKKKQEFM